MNCELVFGLFSQKKAEFPFPRWLSHRMRTEQSQGTHSRLYFGPASCHNSRSGNLPIALHTYSPNKNGTAFPLLRHTAEKSRQHQGTDTATWRMFPTDVGCSQRKFTTAEPTPYVVRRTSCKLCAVAAFDEENPVFRWKYGFPSF